MDIVVEARDPQRRHRADAWPEMLPIRVWEMPETRLDVRVAVISRLMATAALNAVGPGIGQSPVCFREKH